MINNIIKRDREKKCYMDYVIILFTILVYKTKARISVQREKNSKVACTKPVDMPNKDTSDEDKVIWQWWL